jgi:hypothetical protein
MIKRALHRLDASQAISDDAVTNILHDAFGGDTDNKAGIPRSTERFEDRVKITLPINKRRAMRLGLIQRLDAKDAEAAGGEG